MKIFKINEKYEIVCESERTRYGFRHLATMFRNGVDIADAKCCYYNRTWERYEFQSVILNVIKKADLSEEERKFCNDWAEGDHTDWSGFKAIAMVAKMGDVLCSDQKEKNDWKARMIKAGLGENIQMPEDWDSLSEDEKAHRLDLVINQLGGKQ